MIGSDPTLPIWVTISYARPSAVLALSRLVLVEKTGRLPGADWYRSNFLPDAGKLLHTRAPTSAPHRLETGFQEGDDVSSYYDPMVSVPFKRRRRRMRMRIL